MGNGVSSKYVTYGKPKEGSSWFLLRLCQTLVSLTGDPGIWALLVLFQGTGFETMSSTVTMRIKDEPQSLGYWGLDKFLTLQLHVPYLEHERIILASKEGLVSPAFQVWLPAACITFSLGLTPLWTNRVPQ